MTAATCAGLTGLPALVTEAAMVVALARGLRATAARILLRTDLGREPAAVRADVEPPADGELRGEPPRPSVDARDDDLAPLPPRPASRRADRVIDIPDEDRSHGACRSTNSSSDQSSGKSRA